MHINFVTQLRHTSQMLTIGAVAFILLGCASRPICEDILEVKRQEARCAELAKTMNKSNYPQQALTARKQFEQECTELRYQRDDYDTICKGDNKPIGVRKENEQK